MPTLFRLLVILGVIVALGYAGLVALATLVQPVRHEIVVTIPPAKLGK